MQVWFGEFRAFGRRVPAEGTLGVAKEGSFEGSGIREWFRRHFLGFSMVLRGVRDLGFTVWGFWMLVARPPATKPKKCTDGISCGSRSIVSAGRALGCFMVLKPARPHRMRRAGLGLSGFRLRRSRMTYEPSKRKRRTRFSPFGFHWRGCHIAL